MPLVIHQRPQMKANLLMLSVVVGFLLNISQTRTAVSRIRISHIHRSNLILFTLIMIKDEKKNNVKMSQKKNSLLLVRR